MWLTDSQTTSVSWVAGPLRATIIWYRQCCHPPCTNWFSDYTHIVECISTKMQPTFLWMFLNSDHFKTITAVNRFRWNCALTRQITRRFRQFCQHLSCCCEIGKQPLRWKDDLKKVRAQFSNSSMGCFSVRLRWSCHRCAWVHYWLFCRAQKSFSSKQAGKGWLISRNFGVSLKTEINSLQASECWLGVQFWWQAAQEAWV